MKSRSSWSKFCNTSASVGDTSTSARQKGFTCSCSNRSNTCKRLCSRYSKYSIRRPGSAAYSQACRVLQEATSWPCGSSSGNSVRKLVCGKAGSCCKRLCNECGDFKTSGVSAVQTRTLPGNPSGSASRFREVRGPPTGDGSIISSLFSSFSNWLASGANDA